MAIKDLESRVELLNFYTKNSVLPNDEVIEDDIHLLLEIITQAFESIKESNTRYISDNEETLNSQLQMSFTDLVSKNVELQRRIESISEEPLSINFDATRLKLRPDFVILLRDSDQFSLSVTLESKIVDETKLSLRNYCNNGINRFVTGNYAWDVTKAIMIAYMRDDSTIRTRLTTHLQEGNPLNSVKFAVKEMPTVVSEVKGDVSYTVHDRKFKYIHRPKSERPGPITLCHVGLK